MANDSFVFYRSFYEALQNVPKKHRAAIYEAVFAYAFESREVSLSGVPRALWELIRPQLDASQRRYENSKKGAEYGKMGGRPRKNTEKEKPLKGYEEKTLNYNSNSNVNVNDNYNGESLRARARDTLPKQDFFYQSQFIPPTLEEVESYCRERNSKIDAGKFVDFYTANGWMMGKTPMQNWQAALKVWEKRPEREPPKRFNIDDWEPKEW